MVLSWAGSGDSVNITMSSSYLGISSGSFTWAECWLIFFTFFWKSSILICLRSQVCGALARPLEISNLSAPTSNAILHYLRLPHYLVDSTPGQWLLSIAVSLRSDSVRKIFHKRDYTWGSSSTQCRFCSVLSYTSKHQSKCTVHPSTLCGCSILIHVFMTYTHMCLEQRTL